MLHMSAVQEHLRRYSKELLEMTRKMTLIGETNIVSNFSD
jgi:hypothetical protein